MSRASDDIADRRFAAAVAPAARPAFRHTGDPAVLVPLNITPAQARNAAVAVCDAAIRTGAPLAARGVLEALGLAGCAG